MAKAAARPPGAATRVTLLSVTVLGTMCNNVVNVPLRSIAHDLDASLAAAVLCVSAFVLALAITMPLAGWMGDRIGQKRTLVISIVVMLVAQGLAAAAPNLAVLVALRGLQGLACSAIPPMVMGLLGAFYPEHRIEMMGAWAAANGVGQAIGPPVGGLISDAFGWRFIFVALAAACAVVLALMVRFVPEVGHRSSPLDVRGAILLTGGVGLVLVGATTFSQRAGSPSTAIVEVLVGLLLLVGYVAASRGRATAMIPLRVMVESRFLRSTTAAFGQMFCLGTVLVAMPLYFTGPLGLSVAVAGVLLFALPATMAVAAPIVSRLSRTIGPRVVLRTGLVMLVVGNVVVGLVAASTGTVVTVTLTVLLLALGFGMAMVQTPAAAGATGSPAGAYGAAVGLFSMVRFSGSATAAAWVALVYPSGSMPLLFAGCAALAAAAFAASYLGPDPAPFDGTALTRTASPG